MNPRRRPAALSNSPVLVGAVTLLIAIVAVYLSYNANSGLPFVPTLAVKPRPYQRERRVDRLRVRGRPVGRQHAFRPAAQARH